MAGFPLLSSIVFLPLAGGLLLAFVDGRVPGGEAKVRWASFLFSLATLLLGVALFFEFRPEEGGMQFVERLAWVPGWGVSYHLGVDGLSLLLVLLTAFLTPVAILASWSEVRRHAKSFYMAMLFLETGMLGVFVALDLFLFYIFWEAMLVPMYLIIGVWGGEGRIYAAVKFILYTMAGSVLMLVAILVLYFAQAAKTGRPTFDLLALLEQPVDPSLQLWLFLAFGVAFAIKVPMFPFHTWLPDAHVEAPTAGSVLLAGVLLKMGTYGFVRFAIPLFPSAARELAPWVAALAIVGILYGAMVAMVQPDLKKLVAYSSVSHLGFVMLGLVAFNAEGLQGATLQMVNHGISTGALFLIVGMIYERRHTRFISDFGGLARAMPLYTGFVVLTVLSSIGLPGLNGFVGEFTILVGAFRANWLWAALAAAGVVLAALYMLWMVERVFFGPLAREENRSLPDLGRREVCVLLPMALLMVWVGLYPGPLFARMEASADVWLRLVRRRVIRVEAPAPPPADLARLPLRGPAARAEGTLP